MAKLKKELNLYGLTMIVIGAVIGSGIFRTPSDIGGLLHNHLLIILVWVLGGVVALTGALTFSELGGMFPKAGGVYVFIKEAYGELAGFLYGWAILLVINTGALAALGMVFSDYMTTFFDLTDSGKSGLAIAVIIVLTFINIIGVNVTQVFANVFTGLKLIAIVAIILAGFIFYNPEVNLNFTMEGAPPDIMTAMFAGLVGVLWSIGGWHHASYVASETIDAQRTVPRAMVMGVSVIMTVYILINLSIMFLLPLPEIMASEKVAGDAIASISAIPYGGEMVAIAISISIFGTIGIYTMTAPRIYFAMAEDGVFFKQLAYVHPKYRTPVYAMLLQMVWACVLILFWGSFHKLINYVVFMDLAFMTLAGISIFIFRQKRKDAYRPVRAWGYPIIPLIFIVISFLFVGSTLLGSNTKEQSLAGLGVLAIGVAVYYLLGFNKDKSQDSESI
jgi:APA family basic amino acid/polyamine antiporter